MKVEGQGSSECGFRALRYHLLSSVFACSQDFMCERIDVVTSWVLVILDDGQYPQELMPGLLGIQRAGDECLGTPRWCFFLLGD